ncbi:AAA family ATPase [Stenoxybacter acetivorans]|uniref:AAA family ATPase n=1 Tax=Stenoxybacter acetivorans TaxID=422441 RepID=UPI000560C8E6|nr:AAA family ATPase [Stenoxybacter acetivorans]
MIITRIKIDNLYSFQNTEIDFTYSRKKTNSTIDGEFLDFAPKFYFKKVCIISGTNASGKTALGKVLCYFLNFITGKNNTISDIVSGVFDKERNALLELDFVTLSDQKIHRVKIEVASNSVNSLKTLFYVATKINGNDSAEKAKQKLKDIEEKQKGGTYINSEQTSLDEVYEQLINKNIQQNWYFLVSENETGSSSGKINEFSVDLLGKLLKIFDPSVSKVNPIFKEVEVNGKIIRLNEGCEVIFANGDKAKIDDDCQVMTDPNRFSKGTFEILQVAGFINRIMNSSDSKVPDEYQIGTFFLDEKMAYSNSHLEQAVVTLIISKLGRYAQFFYTTHNYDILDLNLPVHSFLFMKKDMHNTEIIHPDHTFQKNDRKLLNYVKNDYFHTIPDMEILDELIFGE